MIKPDGVMRGLIGEIVHRFEKAGLRIVAMKMVRPTKEMVMAHYPTSDEAWINRLGDKALSGLEGLPLNAKDAYGTEDTRELGDMIINSLVGYLQSGPVIAMVIEGVQAVDMVRKLVGSTLPYKADCGTIRGDFSVDTPAIAHVEKRSIHNIIHASENIEEATNEIKLWFKGEKIHDYSRGDEDISYCKHY
jgi:nucleoside-diphosphate kinase